MAYQGPGRLCVFVNYVFKKKMIFFRPIQAILRVVLHLEIPSELFNNGLRLVHPYNVIVHPHVKTGKNMTIYNNVTIGVISTGKRKGAPTIEDNVTIYPYSVILGNIILGKNAIIGAGSVVIHSVPENSSVAGNPAKVIQKS